MRKTVCKQLRKRAAFLAPESKVNIRSKIKRYFTGKTDEKGYPVVRDLRRDTVVASGRQRVYQDLKRVYRHMRCNGSCSGVGHFLSRIPVPARPATSGTTGVKA